MTEAATTEVALAPPDSPAKVELTLRIGPLSSVVGDVAAVVGESVLALLSMFYPTNTAKKANVVITELVTNVFENVFEPGSSFAMTLVAERDLLEISVTNAVTSEVFDKVKAKVDSLGSTADAKKMLAQTIRERRPQRLKGGLGLIRLVAENRFALSATLSNEGMMTVSARYVVERAP